MAKIIRVLITNAMKRGFGSDNHSGICPEVLEAIVRVNKEHALEYYNYLIFLDV